MKTLVNKNNPAIRITAPEIELWIESAYVVGQHLSETENNRVIALVLDRKDWTLVEGIKGNLEEIPSNVVLEKEAVAFCFDNGINVTPYQATIIARHFYELGRKGGSK